MIFAFTFLGGFENPAQEMEDKKAINKRTKIGLREEMFFIGSGLFF
jgi:hypothetical protein